MSARFPAPPVFFGVLFIALVSGSLEAAQTESRPRTELVMTLEELERLAAENNPTLRQAEAAVRAAEGRRVQAGLYPNPVMGYMGEELSVRAPSKTSEHLFFLEQAIVTAGKLRHRREVAAGERAEAEAELATQKLRVRNSVRLLYYEALGAQELVDLRGRLAELAAEAVTTSDQLLNVGAADRPDALEASIELQQAEIDLMQAEHNRDRVWAVLVSVVGDPALPRARLRGSLEADLPSIDFESALSKLLRESPEIDRARAGVERARAALERERAEPVPDILLRGGFGYNLKQSDFFEGSIGPETFIEVGLRVPLFDRNQGNIAAARAEIDRAEREVRRLELALRAQLAGAYERYQNTSRLVARYREHVLPSAQEAYELYLARFREMAAAYPQVLIAQRTFFQVRVRYVDALVELRQSAVLLDGMLLAGGLSAPGESRMERQAPGSE